MAADLEAIKAALPLSDLVSQFVSLTKKGHEFSGLCPFHNENTPSFTVNNEKELFHCFGCGASGDHFDFVAKFRNVEFKEALRIVADYARVPLDERPAAKPRAPESDATDKAPIMPVPDGVPVPSFRHAKHGDPARTWTYKDAAGRALGYIARFDTGGGHKEILPRVWTAAGWAWKSFTKPRPLYGLDLLAAAPGANVIITEGEKAADAARALFPGVVVITWPGGSQAVKHADFMPLAGRKCVIWPDADAAGAHAALDVAAMIERVGGQVRVAAPPADAPKGWDAADAQWTPEQAGEWLRAALVTPDEFRRRQEPPQAEEPPPNNGPGEREQTEPGEPAELPDAGNTPFQALGHDHGTYYYLARGSKQVIELTSAGHSLANLLSLAPLTFWEREYPSKSGVDLSMATNALFRMNERVGVYDPARARGRGAWWDDGTAVLHVGDKLITQGQEWALDQFRSRYIYEAARPMRMVLDDPLSAKEAAEFVGLCKMLSWERPINGTLLAGWCALAPICGALSWRPHVWLSGPSGSGKSWVYNNVVSRVLGDTAFAVLAATTGAGIRQNLKSDARPVIFDEAESETPKARARMQEIMDLMRQSSSETQGAIYHGTQGGDGVSYRIRSMFLYASILVAATQQADQNRITVLTLINDHAVDRHEKEKRFTALQAKQAELLTVRYIERMQARVISLIPVIRKNAETFAVAGAKVLGARRLGDQLGHLLAGAFALHSGKEISAEDAGAWIARQEWTEETAIAESRDELRCLGKILETVARVQTTHTAHTRSVGELIAHANGGGEPDDPVDMHRARAELLRMGIKIHDADVLISNDHSAIEKMLANTPWAANWGRVLKRIEGAHSTGAHRFGPGQPSRATAIPLINVIGEP